MKNKLALVIAVALGLVAVYGVMQYVSRTETKYKTKYVTHKVAAAKEYLPKGTVIRPKHLLDGGRSVPEAGLSADHVLYRDSINLIGLTINRTAERNTPLLHSYFRRAVERLQTRLEPRQRALTLRVDAVTGVAGNLVPGSHVDIIGTFPVPAAPREKGKPTAGSTTLTKLVLANVKILAVDNRLRETEYGISAAGTRRGAYSTVTVAVVPEEVNILIYAQDFGLLTLSLRPPADSEVQPLPSEINDSNLLEKASQAQQEREKRLKEASPMQVAP